MEQLNLDEMNRLIDNTWRLIDGDALNEHVWEIEEIKSNFFAIQKAINNEKIDEKEKKWIIASIFQWWMKKDKEFWYKTFKWKIDSIFYSFDNVYESVWNIVETYTKFGEGLVLELNKLNEFIVENDVETLTPIEQREMSWYKVMQTNLTLTLNRLWMQKTSAEELFETMRINRPIFQTILSSCLIEIAWQRTLDASMQMLSTMSGVINTTSETLTKSTIATSYAALEAGSRPMLDSGKLQDNIKLLWKALEDIDKKKTQLLLK